MILVNRRTVMYTPGLTDEAAAAVESIPAAATEAEIASTLAPLPPRQEIRITVSTYTALHAARYEAHRRHMWKWIEAETGQPIQTMREAPTDSLEFAYIRAGIQWARTLAGLVAFEARPVDAAGAPLADWQPEPMPETWRSPAGYNEAVPADLAAALDDAIVLLNPGLFGMDETADAKKNARISAG